MLSYLHSCLGQAECTEQISRGRQWWRKYEALERSEKDTAINLKSEMLFSRKSEDFPAFAFLLQQKRGTSGAGHRQGDDVPGRAGSD